MEPYIIESLNFRVYFLIWLDLYISQTIVKLVNNISTIFKYVRKYNIK